MPGIEVRGPDVDRSGEVLTPAALEFLGSLERQFRAERAARLAARATRAA